MNTDRYTPMSMETPNNTVHDDCKYGRAAYRASWFSNFKNRQIFLAHSVYSPNVLILYV